MANQPLALKEADAVEITTVLDNTCDMLLPSTAARCAGFRSARAWGTPRFAPSTASRQR
jgi:hypothetical protein